MTRLRTIPSLLVLLAALAGPSLSASITLSLGSDGNTINYTVRADSSTYTCVNISLDNGPWQGGFCSLPGPGNVSSFFTCNWPGVHTVSAEEYGSGTPHVSLGSQTITVTAPAPAFCNLEANTIKFDITNDTPPNDRRVLLSNTHSAAPGGAPNYSYPHYQDLLAKDAAIPVNLRIFYNAAPTSGIPVTLKIIDPPDPSEYIVGSQSWQGQPVPGTAMSHVDDNAGAAATFHGNCVPCTTYSVTSGANGYIETELDIPSGAHAGDNYQVEATASFPDGSTKTTRSGVITAWKRMFVEKKRMYRNGVALATDAPMGTTHIIVPDVDISNAVGDRLGHNDSVLLLHAPHFGAAKTASSYYSGLYTISAHPKTLAIPASGYPSAGRGTIATNGSAAIVGTGTHFNSQVHVDDVINIPTGSGQAEPRWVLAVQDNTHLTVNVAPTASGAGLAYTIGDPNLLPGTTYIRLTLDRALNESYEREPLVPVATGVLQLNDAVVRTAGPTPGPLEIFDTDEALLTGGAEAQWAHAFPSAYTEYIILPLQAPTAVPRALFPNGDPLAQWFVDKWFALPVAAPFGTPPTAGCGSAGCAMLGFDYTVPANHQLVLIGDSPLAATDLGQTQLTHYQTVRQRCTVVDRGFIESRVTNAASQLYQMNADNTVRRVEVHEIAHQRDVNPTSPANNLGHCQRLGYDSTGQYPQAGTAPPATTHFCVMAVDPALTYPAPWNNNVALADTNRAYEDTHTAFHMIQNGTNWDSEYLTIRGVLDPWTP